MNDSEYWEKVELIHNATCPICGIKASFRRTGLTSFQTLSCGHKEMEDLIEERELLFFPPPPRPSYSMPPKPKRKM